MPFEFREDTSPKGAPLLRIHAGGHIALEDAERLGVRLSAGGPNHGWLVLSIVDKNTDYAPAARKHFATMKGHYRGLATVVTGAIARAAINIMMRLTGQAPTYRMFSREDEALAWLDGLPE